MNYFASVRYNNSCCTAENQWRTPFIPEEQRSLGLASLEPIMTPSHTFMPIFKNDALQVYANLPS